MEKIYSVDAPSMALGAKRRSLCGVNPILRFLSDEKSVLYQTLQNKEKGKIKISKENNLKKIVQRGSKSLS